MNEITFSICIPNYNYADYIGQTIESVLSQSYPHFEIVVADNASTDHSVEVVESFASDKIRLVRNRFNIGFAPNLQRVTMQARNDFMNLLSSDDLMRPGALETYAEILQSRGEEAHRTVLCSAADVVDGEGEPIMMLGRAPDSFALMRYPLEHLESLKELPSHEEYEGRQVLADSLRRLTTSAVFCTTVYPHRMWEEVEGYNGIRTMTPDTHFFMKLMSREPTFIYVNRPLYAYRKHSKSQGDQQKSQRSVRLQLDHYLTSLEAMALPLERYGLDRGQVERIYLTKALLTPAFVNLAKGEPLEALRLFSLAVATYPWRAFQTPHFYAVAALLPLGPLARLIAWPIWRCFGGRTVPFALRS